MPPIFAKHPVSFLPPRAVFTPHESNVGTLHVQSFSAMQRVDAGHLLHDGVRELGSIWGKGKYRKQCLGGSEDVPGIMMGEGCLDCWCVGERCECRPTSESMPQANRVPPPRPSGSANGVYLGGVMLLSTGIAIVALKRFLRSRQPSALPELRGKEEYEGPLLKMTRAHIMPTQVWHFRKLVRDEAWDDVHEALSYADKHWSATRCAMLQYGLVKYAPGDIPADLALEAIKVRGWVKSATAIGRKLMEQGSWDALADLCKYASDSNAAALSNSIIDAIEKHQRGLSDEAGAKQHVSDDVLENAAFLPAGRGRLAKVVYLLAGRGSWERIANIIAGSVNLDDEHVASAAAKAVVRVHKGLEADDEDERMPMHILGMAARSPAKWKYRFHAAGILLDQLGSLSDDVEAAGKELKSVLRYARDHWPAKKAKALAHLVLKQNIGYYNEQEELSDAINGLALEIKGSSD